MHLFGEVYTSSYLKVIEQAQCISFLDSCGAGKYTVAVVQRMCCVSAKQEIKDNLYGDNIGKNSGEDTYHDPR